MVTLFESRIAKKFLLVLVGVLVVVLLSTSLLADEPEKLTLTVTDGGVGFLSWCEKISIFQFDPIEKTREEKPIVVCDSPADPVEFSLPEGDYEAVISILGFRIGSVDEELFVIPLGQIGLSENMVFDIWEAEISPEDVPRFIPSAAMTNEDQQKY
jgi:hypothetical protein